MQLAGVVIDPLDAHGGNHALLRARHPEPAAVAFLALGLAAAVGIGTLIITASGVFIEMQQTLNVIWRAEPRGTTMSSFNFVSPVSRSE
jgi:hypothetical protein